MGSQIYPDMNQTLYSIATEDYRRLSDYIQSNYGIQLPDTKQRMVEARLQRRIKNLNLNSFKDYLDYVFSGEGEHTEYYHMVDFITTNKTDFFREPAHFEFMNKNWLPEMFRGPRDFSRDPLKIWSSACSSGEEIYTIAITLEEYKSSAFKLFNYNILGTDLSLRALQNASSGVYTEEKVEVMPLYLRKKYLLRSKGANDNRVVIKPTLKSNIRLKRFNLLKSYDAINDQFDLIFCRNVLIYFSKETQQEVVSNLIKKLKVGGYLFIGHAESLTNLQLPVVQIKPTIYKKIA